MAVPRVVAERIYLSTLGMIRSSGGGYDALEIARAQVLRSRTVFGETYNWSEIRSVVNRAVQGWEDAGQFGPTDAALDPNQHAIDPSIIPGTGQYQYRVVVEVELGGRTVADTAVNVTSNMPLTPGEVRDLARDVATGERPGRDYPNEVAGSLAAGGEVRTYILTAGRAS